jgi:hypothetical protein
MLPRLGSFLDYYLLLQDTPSATPSEGAMSSVNVESGLGSLAQSARSKQLKSARAILYFVGIITVVVNAGFVFFADAIVASQIDREVAELRRQGAIIDEEKVAEVRATSVQSVRLSNSIAILIGGVFLVCGALVYRYPVPTTIISLVLYLGAQAAYGAIDPTTLARGWIVKILIVVGLVKAVQAALAFEREREDQAAQSAPLGAFGQSV